MPVLMSTIVDIRFTGVPAYPYETHIKRTMVVCSLAPRAVDAWCCGELAGLGYDLATNWLRIGYELAANWLELAAMMGDCRAWWAVLEGEGQRRASIVVRTVVDGGCR